MCYNKAIREIFNAIHDIFEGITAIETEHFMGIKYDDCNDKDISLFEKHTSELINDYYNQVNDKLYPIFFSHPRDDDDFNFYGDEPCDSDEEDDD